MFSRFRILLLLLTIAGWQLSAAPRLVRAVSMSGKYCEVENPVGTDHIYVFDKASDASFETWGGESATWTELQTGDTKTNYTMYQSVQDGYCYEVEVKGKKETFVFIEYNKHRLQNLEPEIVMDCNQTTIDLGNMTAISYYTDSLNPSTHKYDVTTELKQKIVVGYNNQRWAEKDWETVWVEDTVKVGQGKPIVLDSILCDTHFAIREDSISEVLYDAADSIVTETKEAVAVAHHQQYFITKRGKTLENENEGPYENNTIIHSAPLDVLYEAHPSSKADVYTWTIKRGDEIYTQRNDKDIRYTFDEASDSGPVIYNIYLQVLNSQHQECMSSAQDTITLKESFIKVPNVFTPNGDGINDEFRVAYRSICEFHCWVYNRWQHLVYKWDDPTKGWDGTYNGKKEPASAYIYIIEARGCDGQFYKLKGTVNLLIDGDASKQ